MVVNDYKDYDCSAKICSGNPAWLKEASLTLFCVQKYMLWINLLLSSVLFQLIIVFIPNNVFKGITFSELN